jgi:IS30 family transposase
MRHYKQLLSKERRQLRVFLDMGISIADIAKRLYRHRSTLYRELGRNEGKPSIIPPTSHLI